MVASLVAVALCIGATPTAGTLLTYEGEVAADRENEIRKQITYTALVVVADENGTTMYWVVNEKGQGAWPWVKQFGQLQLDARGNVISGRPASVLFEHADGISPVPLSPVIFSGPKELADGVSWREDRLQFKVTQPEDAQIARDKWQIDVATAIGHKRTLLVEKSRRVITDVDEIVFMGPGKKHRLLLTLADEKELSAEGFATTRDAFESLFKLRKELANETQGGRVQWSDDQLALLKRDLPEIVEQATGTPVESLAMRAGGDVKLKRAVAAAAAALQKQFIGKPTPRLELPSASLSGPALSTAKPDGKPFVLHIWDYKDNPLVEPYGQIGYLDFLYRRHKADGVRVFGIAVDDRLDRPDTRSEAIRSVRKLRAFMNVGYPIVLGGREVLEQFGDPTQFGAELPLVVVINGDGKIAHYHLGHYEIDRDHGLAELDAAVKAAK